MAQMLLVTGVFLVKKAWRAEEPQVANEFLPAVIVDSARQNSHHGGPPQGCDNCSTLPRRTVEFLAVLAGTIV